jgi:hypothetical protein
MSRGRAKLTLAATLVLSLIVAAVAVGAGANDRGDRSDRLRIQMIGFEEVPPLNTTGRGDLRLEVSRNEIEFNLRYTNLSAPPAVAHIHVGQKGVNGGVSVFFCGGGGKPACPATTSGTVSGSIVAADVVGPTTQGFPAGDLAPLLRAMDAGVTYANMHSPNFPAGEIRGQIPGDRDDRNDD